MSKEHRRSPRVAVDDGRDEARYRATFHQAAIGIAHTTPDSTVLDVNPALCSMLGYTRGELAQTRLADIRLVNAEALERSGDASLEKLLSGEIKAHACTEQYRHKTGATVWVRRTVSVAADESANPYLIQFMEDITERMHAQEEQRQSNLRYQRTLESALECIVVTDHLEHIIEFNPMAERVFGYARGQVLGRKLSDVLVPPRLRRRHEASMERLLSSDQRSMLNRRIETIALRADGSTIPVELTMQRITDTDPPLFTGFLRDISERKEAEAKILRLNRLYHTLSHTSALIVRAGNRKALFEGICRVAKEHGGFLMPWVGLLDPATGMLVLDTHVEDGQFDIPPLSILEDVPQGRSPAGTAMREARIVVCNDLASDPDNALWRDRHRHSRLGVHSLAALPLMTGGKAIGVFVLNSSVAGYFDEDIQQLLREMVAEISFALDQLDLETKHREALSALRESDERFRQLAHYDTLTNLPNRALFCERLTHGIAQAARNGWTLGVMVIDLDRFKTVNDTLGHTTGDTLLRQVASRLVECVRAEDTVSRLSGDEFAVVLAHLGDADDAGLVAAKILRRMRFAFDVDSAQIAVSASIGITLYPGDGDNPDILMRNADVAMYNAKSRGRDNYQFYTAEMNARALAKLQLESKLRGALDRQEFILHYQPKVDIESGAICGFEALLRWQPPNQALVPPGDFIPLLEETGLITPVGEWVVKAACAQAAAWIVKGLEAVPIAINLSPRQLRHAGFTEVVSTALEHCGIEAQLLEIEITESLLMDNPEEAQKALGELKALGVTLAIDDFGTGYSSLAYLKRFPFDTLKIDRSFVRDIDTDPEDALIARTIIGLAQNLGLTVVAEGVETQAQLDFLVANQCDLAQGYLFSRPVPAEAATGLLQSGMPLHAAAPRGVSATQPAVLVLDHERDRLIDTQQLLQRDGYQVLTASRVQDALEWLSHRNICVVIADEHVRDLPGAEFFGRMKERQPQAVRIMLGGAGDARAMSAALSEGAVHRIFVRGRDDRLLRDEVKKVMRRSSPRAGVARSRWRKSIWAKLRRGKASKDAAKA